MAVAQSYPDRPVRVVVPYAPGGPTDVITRLIAQKLSDRSGKQFFVENIGGGGGNIAMGRVAKMPPDGYTLLMVNPSYVVNPTLYRDPPYRFEKDFDPVSLAVLTTLVIAVHPSVPARTIKELIALARARPGQLNFSSAGNASANHLATAKFMNRTGTNMVHVPYKGGGPALISLVQGETSLLFATIPSSIDHIKGGRLKAIGVSRLQRSPALPDVPTIAESGVPGFEAIEWNGIMVPAGTPQASIRRAQQALAKALAIPAVKERIVNVGAEIVGSSPEEFAAFLKSEYASWAKVVKEVGITVE
jgi:tripartite-type tricarboxylate transporter receptor subunit TctC